MCENVIPLAYEKAQSYLGLGSRKRSNLTLKNPFYLRGRVCRPHYDNGGCYASYPMFHTVGIDNGYLSTKDLLYRHAKYKKIEIDYN